MSRERSTPGYNQGYQMTVERLLQDMAMSSFLIFIGIV